MMSDILINVEKKTGMIEFLGMNGFAVEDLGENIYRVVRGDELPVYLHVDDSGIYFEVDLGNVSEIGSEGFYYKLLDLNTETQPVSFGINSTNADDPRLVLVENREVTDLSDHELLSVFDALELAVDKAETFLSETIKS